MSTVIDLLRRHGVTVEQLATATERRVETIQDWIDGWTRPPGHIALVVAAVAKRLEPLTDKEMMNHDLVATIGIERSTQYTWRNQRSFPITARLACAAIAARNNITAQDKLIIHRVAVCGAYYRVTGGWRARPIMGKTPPAMKAATPLDLVRRGYLQIHNGQLRLTDKGKTVEYGTT